MNKIIGLIISVISITNIVFYKNWQNVYQHVLTGELEQKDYYTLGFGVLTLFVVVIGVIMMMPEEKEELDKQLQSYDEQPEKSDKQEKAAIPVQTRAKNNKEDSIIPTMIHQVNGDEKEENIVEEKEEKEEKKKELPELDSTTNKEITQKEIIGIIKLYGGGLMLKGMVNGELRLARLNKVSEVKIAENGTVELEDLFQTRLINEFDYKGDLFLKKPMLEVTAEEHQLVFTENEIEQISQDSIEDREELKESIVSEVLKRVSELMNIKISSENEEIIYDDLGVKATTVMTCDDKTDEEKLERDKAEYLEKKAEKKAQFMEMAQSIDNEKVSENASEFQSQAADIMANFQNEDNKENSQYEAYVG
jgi:hypothetical protein